MKNLLLLVVVAVSLSACGVKSGASYGAQNATSIEHTYRTASMLCNGFQQITVPDEIIFSTGGKVVEGGCSADYAILDNQLTISNLVGTCAALPDFSTRANTFYLSTDSSTGLVSLSFEPDTSWLGGCSISLVQVN